LVGDSEFITLLGSAAATWSLTARAQPIAPRRADCGRRATGKKVADYRGALGGNTLIPRPVADAFVQRPRELAWIDGRTIKIEYRRAEGYDERLPELAANEERL
jgi:hypothetical protein